MTGIDIKAYEASKQWKAKSKKLLENKEMVCCMCGKARWRYQPRVKKWKRLRRCVVHHVSYLNVPNEKPEDLMLLCWGCHDFSHTIFRLAETSEFYRALKKVVEAFGFRYIGGYGGFSEEVHTE
jgi:hypothetical protein